MIDGLAEAPVLTLRSTLDVLTTEVFAIAIDFLLLLGCVGWVAMYPPGGLPKDLVEPTIGGSDYWANKVRMQYRKTNPDQASARFRFRCGYCWW